MNVSTQDNNELLTADQVAEMLKVSRHTVYRLKDRRLFASYQTHSGIRFQLKDIQAYLDSCRVEAITDTNTYGYKNCKKEMDGGLPLGGSTDPEVSS